MKHFVSLWRLTLRKILTALMGAVSFLFGACPWPDINGADEYGMQPMYGMPAQVVISGTVSYDEKPVPGFWVSILTEYSSYPNTRTNPDGTFELYVSKTEGGSYTVFFQDVDGPLNGEFDSQTVQWTSGDGPLNIVLNPKESEPEN